MKKMQIIEECEKFESCYLGDVSFNVLKDTKSWMRFLRKHELDTKFGITYKKGEGWFLIKFPNC